jgi:2-hydroxychromene-2-carboxylate isomerase
MKDALIKNIQPYAALAISSTVLLKTKRCIAEFKRRILGQAHEVDVYLRINDPYSYLLVQVLADFEQRYEVKIQFKTIMQLQDDMYPEMDMWHRNGFIDAAHLAKLYQLTFPIHAPTENISRIKQSTECLLQLECLSAEQGYDWQQVTSIFYQYWFQQPLLDKNVSIKSSVLQHRLANNESDLVQRGHYMSAMVHYAGEWYWGLDRLDHLEKRLNALAVNRGTRVADVIFNKTYADFCQLPAITPRQTNKALVLFFSIRSPYSHIALLQAIKLAQHYQLPLEIKPILPMVMRSLLVPTIKKIYIFHDTKREAKKLGIDYGFVADPLGQGVENCYLLFNYAQSLGREQQFILNYSRAVNAQGIRSETNKGLKLIVQSSGMDWDYAKSILRSAKADKEWRLWAENNRQQMLALGFWGVPTFQYGNLILWGQDRMGIIESAIRKDSANDNR